MTASSLPAAQRAAPTAEPDGSQARQAAVSRAAEGSGTAADQASPAQPVSGTTQSQGSAQTGTAPAQTATLGGQPAAAFGSASPQSAPAFTGKASAPKEAGTGSVTAQSLSTPTKPVPVPSSGQASAVPQIATLDPARAGNTDPVPSSGPLGSNPSGGAAAPSFDIIRVEPSGESVVAARGAPNSEIVLLDGRTVIAKATADASGQVAFLPPALKPGEHSLTLSMKAGSGSDTVSSQSVVVSVPAQPKSAPMVALIQPNQPAAILSGPVAGDPAVAAKPAPGAAAPVSGSASVVIRSVELETMGSFYATGKAAPGSLSRVYLNGASVAAVTADGKGLWSLKINKGMKPGHYAVRVDQVDDAGHVVARAEVPFDYPEQVASNTPRTTLTKKNTIVSGSGISPSAPAAPDTEATVGTDQPGTEAAPPLVSGPQTAAGWAGQEPATAGVAPGGQAPQMGGGPTKTAGQQSKTAEAAPSASGQVSVASSSAPKAAPASPSGSAAAGSSVAATDPTGGAPAGSPDSQASEPTVVAELVTAKVIHGDSLWRISRNMFGHGVRYTQIYAANTQQIRDPRLIYPGQIFVMPEQQ